MKTSLAQLKMLALIAARDDAHDLDIDVDVPEEPGSIALSYLDRNDKRIHAYISQTLRVSVHYALKLTRRYWTIEGIRTEGANKGKPVRCVVEAAFAMNERDAKLFGLGQLRGMGFSVKEVRVIK